MKQYLIVIVLLLNFTSVYAQKKTAIKAPSEAALTKTDKPTKQETMDWIAGKMKEYLDAPRKFVSYNNGVFVYKLESSVAKELGPGTIPVIYINTLDLNKLTGMSEEYSSDFYIYGKKLIQTSWTVDGSPDSSSKDYLSISGPNYKDYAVPFGFKMDKILVERLRAAFVTLMEYNSVQKLSDEKF